MSLDAKILKAHASDDKSALIDLYGQAAEQAQDADTKAFFLTYAYIFALEIGHHYTDELHSALMDLGRV